jgi:hypothetical protein
MKDGDLVATTLLVKTRAASPTPSGGERLELVGIQMLRGIAASLVVFPPFLGGVARLRRAADEPRLAHNIRCIWRRYIFWDQRFYHGVHELSTQAPPRSTDKLRSKTSVANLSVLLVLCIRSVSPIVSRFPPQT